LIDIAATLGITERSAFTIVNELTKAGYVVKLKDGRRNRYEVRRHLLVPGPVIRSTTVAELLALLVGDIDADSSATHLEAAAAAG
jgi:Mn-dependent DtxR family transcriptional regulator